jgi:L-erythrulose 1-phosphate isomerase
LKKILLGTNWKMHKTVEEALKYTNALKELAKDFSQFKFFIIPPYTDLWHVKKELGDSGILLGAQNMHWEEEGAFTGEISPRMLKEIGIDIIELGHSERRQYYNENDYTVNKKAVAALEKGFIPLICIGEYIEDKNYGVTEEVIGRQLKIALHGVSDEDVQKVWIAYEPVWAIGANGIPAEPSYASKVQSHIRKVLMSLYGEEIAREIPILYGGSVNIENCEALIQQRDIDGLFIGRAAWNTESFRVITEKVSKLI